MAKLTQKIKISNDRDLFVTLMLEPWGEDYGVFPGDEFEIVAEDATEDFYFHICSYNQYINVYAEGDNTYPSIYQNGKLLTSGHNRQD